MTSTPEQAGAARVITFRDFLLASAQATLFTPDEEVAAVKLLGGLVPRWIERFDGDPMVIPVDALPREVPKLILRSKSGSWRCEIASARINLVWQQTGPDTTKMSPGGFFSEATRVLDEYAGFTNARVGRIAAVLTRYVAHSSPGLFLARHFCHERWLSAPLNRPESFELHAHKQYLLANRFNVNSWVRSKTGVLSTEKGAEAIVLVEQDLNTLAEESKHRSFVAAETSEFLSVVVSEFDAVLGLYYPAEGAK